MYSNYKKWSNLLKTESFYSKDLDSFERNMQALYGDRILDTWTKWSEKLKKRGLYK